jgi:hypothetical protein
MGDAYVNVFVQRLVRRRFQASRKFPEYDSAVDGVVAPAFCVARSEHRLKAPRLIVENSRAQNMRRVSEQ